MPGTGEVVGHVDGRLGVVTLTRPGKRNAMTRSMWASLPVVLDRVAGSPGVEAVVIRGADGNFSAGADLGEVLAATESPEAATEFCASVVSTLLAIARCPLPTIAALEGVAAGGGAELALAADLRVAVQGATLQLPLARLGVVPDGFTMRRLVALAGPSSARLLLFTGRIVDAEHCLRIGLVDEVVPDEGLEDAVRSLAHAFSAASPYALRRTKQLLDALDEQADLDDLVADMAQSFLHGDVAANARGFMHRSR